MQLLRVGTKIELGHVNRGDAHFSRFFELRAKGEWFYPKSLYMYFAYVEHDSHESG